MVSKAAIVILVCASWGVQAQTTVEQSADLDAVRIEAAALQADGNIQGAETAYLAWLNDPARTDQERVQASILLSTLLIDRAHHEESGKPEFHRRATVLLDEALPLARESGDYRSVAEILRLSWMMQFQQNRLNGSAWYLLDALEALELAGAGENEKATIYGHLSYTYMLSGEFERAIAYQRHNVVRSLELGDIEKQSVDFYVIGDSYLKLGELDVARRYFEQALAPYLDERGRDYFEAVTKLATIQRRSGDPAGALQIHLDVARFFREHGGYREVPAEIEIARDYLALNQLEPAVEHARRALSDQRAFTEQKLDASLVLMQVSQIRGDPDEVQSWIDKIQQLLDQSFSATGSRFIHPLRQIQFAEQSIDYFALRGETERVIESGQTGLSVYQYIRDGLSRTGSTQLSWAASAQPFIDAYIAALYRLDRSRILAVLESTYSQILVGDASGPSADSASTPVDVYYLEEYLAAEERVIDALSTYETDPTPLNLAALEKSRGQRDYSRERYLMTNLDELGNPRQRGPDHPVAASEVAATDLVLRYYIGEDVSFVMIKDHETETFVDLPEQGDVRKLVQDAREEMNIIGADPKNGALTSLAALLPVRSAALTRYQRILIIPDDVTHGIPFAAININPAGEAYQALGETREVLRTYSIYSYYNAVSKPRADGQALPPRLVIFADPVFSREDPAQANNAAFRNWAQSLERLPYTAREAESISRLYDANTVTTYLGSEATSASLLSPSTRSANVLHIATHGYFNPATPDIVGIATSSFDSTGRSMRGFLSLSELLEQSFSSRLIVISGCETMLGRPFGGLGVRSLAQGFIAQGAGAALGTLWKVPDRATAEFMLAFYSALLSEDGDASRALFLTRRKMMSSARFSAPSFWGAFSLTSSNRQMDRHVFQ